MPSLFGTDGIRGAFGEPPLDEAAVVRLGRELAAALATDGSTPVVLLGGDTRSSTPVLARWLARGLGLGGGTVADIGTLPTPGVAFLTRHHRAAAGVAISASHNLPPDNGIKLIDGDGYKWSVEAEAALERRIEETPSVSHPDGRPPPQDPRASTSVEPYLASLTAPFGGSSPLAGMNVVLDLGNGAASPFAADLFAELGARVESLNDQPDGSNINRDCGSTHPQGMADELLRRGCDLGFAFDGDADRALFADHRGRIWDGDAVLLLWARALKESGELNPPQVVATTMSNLALERALAASGIELLRCDVGDREVLDLLLSRELVLGGEQSGHILNLNLATAGDGMQTALHVASIVARAGRPVAELLAGFERYPQLLRNVAVRERRPFVELDGLGDLLEHVERELGEEGRVLLRYSGTEPLARIMLEGPELAALEIMAAEIAQIIDRSLGTEPEPGKELGDEG